jgi:hypothetical protein
MMVGMRVPVIMDGAKLSLDKLAPGSQMTSRQRMVGAAFPQGVPTDGERRQADDYFARNVGTGFQQAAFLPNGWPFPEF